jgi:hypothetical protein
MILELLDAKVLSLFLVIFVLLYMLYYDLVNLCWIFFLFIVSIGDSLPFFCLFCENRLTESAISKIQICTFKPI